MTDETTPTIRKLVDRDDLPWMEWSGTKLADVMNEDDLPWMKLGAVGFSRSPAGSSSAFEFTYDEVLIIIQGRGTISFEDEVLTIAPGELVYLPAGRPGHFAVSEDMLLAYVASSPYGAVNREMRAKLLSEAGRQN